MKKLFLILSIALFLIFTQTTFTLAQSPDLIDDLQLKFEPLTTKNILDTLVRISCIITLKDTNNIAKIHIKARSTLGGSEKFSKSFLFNPSTNSDLPLGASYIRVGNTIYLVVGNYLNQQLYYEAQLEDKEGVLYPSKSFDK
jgi:hypothetical protein